MANELDDLVEKLAAQQAAEIRERVAARVKQLIQVDTTPAKAPALRGRKPAARAQQPKDSVATCPKCGKVGSVAKDFGTKVVHLVSGDVEKPQSWCRDCRKKPRSAGK